MTTYGKDFNIYDIKPNNVKVSDKYSANLYKYFKKNPNSRVFRSKDKNNRSSTEILIGKANDEAITGTTLSHILTDDFKKWYILYSEYGEYEDVTENFMNDYIRIGRCILDKTHSGWVMGDENRFTYTNKNERVCNWCGEVQHKKEVVKVTYEWDNLHEINIYGENKIKSKYPFKVYSISKYNNEIEVFEGAFETLEKAKERYEIMQYIGLKDVNGVEIYEGDILRVWRDDEYIPNRDSGGGIVDYDCESGFSQIGNVGFEGCSFDYSTIKTLNARHEDIYLPIDWLDNYEVIGNIYENPEILENN